MSIAKKILSNTVWQIAGRAVMALVSVVILKAISNYLSVEGYGMYTAVYEFLAFFGIIADLGLFTIAVREMGKGTRSREFIAGNILGMRMSLATIAMSMAVITAFVIPKYSGTYIPAGVAIASISVFLAILHGTVSSVLQVEHKMQWSTLGLVIGKLVSMSWMLAVIFYFFAGEPSSQSFNQLIIAGVVGNLCAFLFTLYFALKIEKIRPQFDREYWKEIATTALPYGLALVLNMVYFRIDSIMLLFMRGPTEVGLYGVPMRVLEILSVIPVYFMNSVLPVLSRAMTQSKEKVQRIIQMAFDFLFMASLPIVVGVHLLAYPIIFIIASPEFLSRLNEGFYGSDIALQILTLAMAFSFMNSLFSYTIVAANKQSLLLWINGFAAIFNIGVNLIVIPMFGFRGSAVTTVATEALILFAAYFVARKYVTFRLNFKTSLKVIVAVSIMGVSVHYLIEPTYYLWGLQNLNVLLLSAVGAVIYGVALFVMGAFPEEFRKKIPRI